MFLYTSTFFDTWHAPIEPENQRGEAKSIEHS